MSGSRPGKHVSQRFKPARCRASRSQTNVYAGNMRARVLRSRLLLFFFVVLIDVLSQAPWSKVSGPVSK